MLVDSVFNSRHTELVVEQTELRNAKCSSFGVIIRMAWPLRHAPAAGTKPLYDCSGENVFNPVQNELQRNISKLSSYLTENTMLLRRVHILWDVTPCSLAEVYRHYALLAGLTLPA
jgi:hypothetical protein